MNSRYGGLQQRMESERLRLANEQGVNRMALMEADRQARLAHMARQVEEQEREMAGIQQAANIEAQLMHNETAFRDEANQATSFESAMSVYNEYQRKSPRERYENIDEYVARSREIYELNPNEQTKRYSDNFAREKLRIELLKINGREPKFQDPVKRKGSGITYNGIPQVKDEKTGKWVNDPNYDPKSKAGRYAGIKVDGKYQITDETGKFVDAPEGWEPPKKTKAKPAKSEPVDEMTRIWEKAKSENPEIAEHDRSQKIFTKIEKLQELRNEFIDHPDVGVVEQQLEREMRRPQYWASTYDALFDGLPSESQRILNKAKKGRIISEQEQDIVALQTERFLKDESSPVKSVKTGIQAVPDSVLMKYMGEDEAGKRFLERKYPALRQEEPEPVVIQSPAPTQTGTSLPENIEILPPEVPAAPTTETTQVTDKYF